MSKVRPKTFCMYNIKTFLRDAECWISCSPQQRWECEIKGDKVTLERKGISLTIPKEDFDKHWREV